MQLATLSRAQAVRCEVQQQSQQQQRQAAVPQRRRLLLAGLGAAALSLPARPAAAAFPGIESIDLPTVDVPAAIAEKQARNQAVLDAAEKSFQESGAYALRWLLSVLCLHAWYSLWSSAVTSVLGAPPAALCQPSPWTQQPPCCPMYCPHPMQTCSERSRSAARQIVTPASVPWKTSTACGRWVPDVAVAWASDSCVAVEARLSTGPVGCTAAGSDWCTSGSSVLAALDLMLHVPAGVAAQPCAPHVMLAHLHPVPPRCRCLLARLAPLLTCPLVAPPRAGGAGCGRLWRAALHPRHDQERRAEAA